MGRGRVDTLYVVEMLMNSSRAMGAGIIMSTIENKRERIRCFSRVLFVKWMVTGYCSSTLIYENLYLKYVNRKYWDGVMSVNRYEFQMSLYTSAVIWSRVT